MLNLMDVLCILLVATEATKASDEDLTNPTQQDFNKTASVSLMRVKKSYLKNLDCIRTEKLSLRLKVNNLVPALLDSSRLEFFIGSSQGSFFKDDPDFSAGNVTVEPQGIKDLKNYMEFIDQTHSALEREFIIQRKFIKFEQDSASACAFGDSDDSDDSVHAVACLNTLEDVLKTMLKDADSMFSQLCGVAERMAKSAFMNLKLCISTQ